MANLLQGDTTRDSSLTQFFPLSFFVEEHCVTEYGHAVAQRLTTGCYFPHEKSFAASLNQDSRKQGDVRLFIAGVTVKIPQSTTTVFFRVIWKVYDGCWRLFK